MRLLRSRPPAPAPVRAAVPGQPLAAVESKDGTWLVGTREAFHAVALDGTTRLSVRWEQVQRADWDLDSETLQVVPVGEFGRPVPAYSFVLGEPGSILPLVRERVTASVLLQRRVELERKRGFTVIGRRSPTGRGEVTWAYELDPGVDPDDPGVAAATGAALREAQESLGL